MNRDKEDYEDLWRRFRRVERYLKLEIWIGLPLGLFLAALISMTWREMRRQAKVPSPIVRANQLHIVDSAGRPRITMGVDAKDHSIILLHDEAGTERMQISAQANGGEVILFRDRNGTNRMVLGRTSDDKLAFVFKDPEDRLRVRVGYGVPGEPDLSFFDGSGEMVYSIGSSDTSPTMFMRGSFFEPDHEALGEAPEMADEQSGTAE